MVEGDGNLFLFGAPGLFGNGGAFLFRIIINKLEFSIILCNFGDYSKGMEEKFAYNCSLKSFFDDYLHLKRPYINAVLTHIHGKESRLNENPLRVLAQLLFYNNHYRALDDDTRWKMVFDYDTRMKICTKLNMPATHLNSYLTQLRRLGIVVGRKVADSYVVYPEEDMRLVFDLKVGMSDE